MCDRIAFIMSGRIVRIDTVSNLIQPIREKHVVQIACSNHLDDLPERLYKTFPGLEFIIPQQGVIRVEADEPVRVGPLIRFLEDQGVEVSEARKIRPSLEDVFIKITGVAAEIMRKEKEKMGGTP